MAQVNTQDQQPQVKIVRRQESVRFFVEELAGGVDLKMMLISGGTFNMGSPEGELERFSAEGPVHPVTVPTFFMGKYPVTQAQYEAVMGSNLATRYGEKFIAPNKPVVGVSWNNAVEFCERLSAYTGRTYRLPSEAEWEYACRAGTETPFHFGETITTEIVNYNGGYTYGDGPKGDYRGETIEVDHFGIANAFGLCDMHGNVWEWCLDHYGSYEETPRDGSAYVTDNENSSRVRRGGSWFNAPENCRSASRSYDEPGGIGDFIGFRVVCSPQ